MSRGADLAEVYLTSAKNLLVEAKGQSVEAVESSISFGYSLRVITDKRLGFSFSTDPRDAEKVVEKATETARWTEQDEYLDLPGASPATSGGIFDEAVAAVTEEDAVAKALALEKAALDSDRRITKVRKASASFSSRDLMIVNSKGLHAAYPATAATAQITVAAEGEGDSQMGWDFDGSRFLTNLSFEAVGRTAAERALRMLGARNMNSLKAPVVLDNSVAVDFLGIFSSLLSAESVQKGRSLLAHRLNEEVMSPMITLVDDGTMNHKLGSRPCDDEGTATSRKNLIEDGVLVAYMYNTRTARKDGVKSTGNAVRGGFSSLPAVGPSNLLLAVSGEHVYSGNLFDLPEKCLYVTEAMGIHTANPVSGEFSIGVSGLWIKNGIIQHPVKEAVLSGNILEFFRKVEAAGDDLRFYGNMASPGLLFGPTDISA
ncbi:MAG TPA: TldD/PmbA family protein [Thermodesulfovibrionales bacterium]|nr:TldD/PmbA family protein [Thermodesulfovibrionales bacterium]